MPTKKKLPEYTGEHARAGIDAPLPEIECWENQFPGYEIVISTPEFTSVPDSHSVNALSSGVFASSRSPQTTRTIGSLNFVAN